MSVSRLPAHLNQVCSVGVMLRLPLQAISQRMLCLLRHQLMG